MAESADVLTADHQQVILPDLNAGCSMADMADLDEVEEAWEALAGVIDIERARADHVHELVGRAEGVRRATRRRRVHVDQRPSRARRGRSAEGGARSCSSPTSTWAATPATRWATTADDMRVWNPRFELGGLTEADCKEATFLLWKGHCSVHQRFRPEHVAAFRAEHPDGIVVAHPECAPRRRARWPIRSGPPTSSSGPWRRRRPARDRRRHRDPPRAAPGQRDARQDGRVARPADLPVLDHVPHRRPPPVLGAREPRRRQRGQPDHRRPGRPPEWAKVALQRMLDITEVSTRDRAFLGFGPRFVYVLVCRCVGSS